MNIFLMLPQIDPGNEHGKHESEKQDRLFDRRKKNTDIIDPQHIPPPPRDFDILPKSLEGLTCGSQTKREKVQLVHPYLEPGRDPEPVNILFLKRCRGFLVEVQKLRGPKVPPFLRALGQPPDLRDHFLFKRPAVARCEPNLFKLKR
jgi:hypothetical protein